MQNIRSGEQIGEEHPEQKAEGRRRKRPQRKTFEQPVDQHDHQANYNPEDETGPGAVFNCHGDADSNSRAERHK